MSISTRGGKSGPAPPTELTVYFAIDRPDRDLPGRKHLNHSLKVSQAGLGANSKKINTFQVLGTQRQTPRQRKIRDRTRNNGKNHAFLEKDSIKVA